ncbi:MAG: hypothetical protein GXO32_03910 [Crenarchaeota archaeon]|nr:hypothetical protein [Thermoproteota archaeon]
MPQPEVVRIVREYMEKVERELLALARKAPTADLRAAAVSLAVRKVIALELLRALMRISDRLESLRFYEEQVRSVLSTESRRVQDLERVLTKLVEIESYQRELPKMLKSLEQFFEREELARALELIEDVEKKLGDELRELIEAVKRDLEAAKRGS